MVSAPFTNTWTGSQTIHTKPHHILRNKACCM